MGVGTHDFWRWAQARNGGARLTMPAVLDAIFPPGMRSRIWQWLEFPKRRRFRKQLKGIALSPRRGSPALNYGDVLAPDGAGLVHGGRVKLLHLAEEFP